MSPFESILVKSWISFLKLISLMPTRGLCFCSSVRRRNCLIMKTRYVTSFLLEIFLGQSPNGAPKKLFGGVQFSPTYTPFVLCSLLSTIRAAVNRLNNGQLLKFFCIHQRHNLLFNTKLQRGDVPIDPNTSFSFLLLISLSIKWSIRYSLNSL